MRAGDEMELMRAYLDSHREARGQLERWAKMPMHDAAGLAQVALKAHEERVRSELISLAVHIFSTGPQLQERYAKIAARIEKAREAMAAGEHGPQVETALYKALDEERMLLVDELIPMIVGTLEEDELREVTRDFIGR